MIERKFIKMSKKDKEEKESVWSGYSKKEKKELEELNAGYRDFLTTCKTERESVIEAVRQAEAAGYRDLSDYIAKGETIQPGDKVYAVNMKKAVVLFQVGSEPLEKGLVILGAHIDTCRLDVKQNPLYEDGGLAYLSRCRSRCMASSQRRTARSSMSRSARTRATRSSA